MIDRQTPLTLLRREEMGLSPAMEVTSGSAFPVDLELFSSSAHGPSMRALSLSMPAPKARGPTKVLRDYSVPANPYFPTPAMLEGYRADLETILKYYPTQSYDLNNVVGDITGLDPATLVLTNGSTELITWLDRLYVRGSLLTEVPTFGRWTDQPQETGKQLLTLLRRPEVDYRLTPDEVVEAVARTGARSFALSNPNNPTGDLMDRAGVISLLDRLTHLDLVVIDESFIDFSEEVVPTVADVVQQYSNAVVVKSLGKNFGLHGARMGYGVTNREMARELRIAVPRWNVNGVAEAVLRSIPANLDAYEASRLRVIEDRVRMGALLCMAGLKVYPSMSNFFFVRLDAEIDGVAFRDHLLTEYGFLIRACGNKIGSDDNHFRIGVRPEAEVRDLVEALKATLTAFGVVPSVCPASAHFR